MEMIKLQVSGSQIQVAQRPAAITAGTVGLEAEFSFDSHWDNLGKTVIFRAGDKVISVALEGNTHIVPWEVLEKPDLWLVVGVYGANAEGTVVIPTLWTKVAAVYTGVDPEGDPALEPSNPIWQEALARVANMEPRLQEHINDMNNPHSITCDQLGAVTRKEFIDVVSNLDGSSDPEGLIPHLLNRDNPHGVTAEQAGAAPGGYGLGEESANGTLWYNIAKSGFYSAVSGSPNSSRWTGIHVNRNKSESYQLAFNGNNDLVTGAIRMRSSQTGWREWEYVNPPMELDVEYCTTERFNGKPVYTKLIDFGILPNADTKIVSKIPKNVTLVSMNGIVSYTSAGSGSIIEYPINSGTKVADFYADVSSGYVAIKTTEDLSARTAKIIVKYTKD